MSIAVEKSRTLAIRQIELRCACLTTILNCAFDFDFSLSEAKLSALAAFRAKLAQVSSHRDDVDSVCATPA